MGKLEVKVAVITGGTSGMALASAKRFVEEGAYVFITGRRQEALAAAVKLIGRNVTGVRGGASNLDDLDRLFDTVKREKGKIDVLFASAGRGEAAELGEITEQQLDAAFGLNVRGTLFTVQKALPLLNDGGSIFMTGSVASVKGFPGFGVYAASKAALPEQGPDARGDSNILAFASRVADPYYIGFSTAAAHYGLTMQHRSVILVVTPVRLRARQVGEARVRIVNLSKNKFFGFDPVDVLGYTVIISDREKTAIDCIERPDRAGRVGEAATIFATASPRLDWTKATSYRERIESGAIARRFGWLTDHVKADMPPNIRERVLQLAAKSRKTWLGPPARGRRFKDVIGYDETWRIFVNVPRDELRGSAGLGQRKPIKKDS